MKPSSRTPLLRSILVFVLALAAVFALSACLARSAPTQEPAEPVETETEAPPDELTEEPRPTAQPGAADLAVSAWLDEGEIAPGGRLTYLVESSNYDDERAAAGVVLTVTLPEGTTLIESTSDEQPFPPSKAAGSQLEYALGTLQPGAYHELALAVELPAKLPPGTRLALTARIAGAAPDPDEETNYAEDVAVIPAPNLIMAVYPSEGCGPFAPGRTASYVLHYSNWSEAEAQPVVITNTLSAGMAFRSAIRVTEGEKEEAIAPRVEGPNLTFELGALAADAWGELLVEIDLDDSLLPDQPLTYTVGIATPDELDPEDNWAEDIQYAQVEGPDAWVELDSEGEGEIDDWQTYWISWGNRGTQDAQDITLSLAIPTVLKDVTFTIPPATYQGGVATWVMGDLEASTGGESIGIDAIIGAAGQAVAKATIGSRQDVDPRNNAAEVADELVAIHAPTITGPDNARVGAQPVVFGFGKPGATVSLYLAGADDLQERPWGTAVADEEGRWEITPTTKLPQPGWYWFMATQELDGRVSALAGKGNYYSDELTIDTNSLTVDGERVGGIDQDLNWVGNRQMTFGARIISCEKPLTPTLQVRYYNPQGLMVNHEKIQPKLTRPDGYVEFDFTVPSEDEEIEWQIELGFYCRKELQTSTVGRSPGLAAPLEKGWTDIYKPGCWFGGCGNDDPDPPKPKPQCPGCSPIERPKQRPKPKDPDGLVYDEAAVKAGAKMTQAIITSAWVTCTRQTAEGTFEPWNAHEYNQVNPQITDTKYPDKVLRPGYYSFLVPPGSYRIQATAPGYLPYVSQTLQVINDPVTLHIPLKRGGGGAPKGLGARSP